MGTKNKRKQSLAAKAPKTMQKLAGEKAARAASDAGSVASGLDCEDPYGDIIEEEFPPSDLDKDSDDEAEIGEDIDVSMEVDDESGEKKEKPKRQQDIKVWRPGVDGMEEGEELVCEPGAYHMLHKAETGWPCLTFDILPDDLGAMRTKYPMTAYVVAGTQAATPEDNRIMVMKWSKLSKMRDEDNSEDEDDDEEDEGDAVLDFRTVQHPGGVNRIRAMPQMKNMVASWADTGKVHMWDLENHMKQLDGPAVAPENQKPLFTFEEHTEEGFAMAWDPHNDGRFASGDCAGGLALWQPNESGWDVKFCVDKGEYRSTMAHSDSVEDIDFKKKGNGTGHLFASTGVDRVVKVWDDRLSSPAGVAVRINDAAETDINVLSWNPVVGDLLLCGHDDGSFKVWDVRNTKRPMANFHWHRKPITSVAWHPTDEAVLSVSSADNTLSIWDCSMEGDVEDDHVPEGADHYPAQLLFLHMGQTDMKEAAWHPQLPGVMVCTAADGFNIFKASNM